MIPFDGQFAAENAEELRSTRTRRASCRGCADGHARFLVPLVRARDFGMTPLLENFADKLRATSKTVWVGHSCPTKAPPKGGAFFLCTTREGHGFKSLS